MNVYYLLLLILEHQMYFGPSSEDIIFQLRTTRMIKDGIRSTIYFVYGLPLVRTFFRHPKSNLDQRI